MKINYSIKKAEVYYLKMEKKPVFNDFGKTDYLFDEIDKPIDTSMYIELYKSVGAEYNWLDRLLISKKDLNALINKENTHICFLKIKNDLVGWAEFVVENNYVELLYFGLLPAFVGQGLGKFFLSLCIEKAWSFNKKWIQLNTCSLDHPNALSTYKNMGFVEYKKTTEDRKVQINILEQFLSKK